MTQQIDRDRDGIPTKPIISSQVISASQHPNLEMPLVTYKLKYPRFIHSELLTHRAFCLSGDSELEFEKPCNIEKGKTKSISQKLTLREFANKWYEGSAPRFKSRIELEPLEDIDATKVYHTSEIAKIVGQSSYSNLNGACRLGELTAHKIAGDRRWFVLGSDYKTYRANKESSVAPYSLKSRLSNMRIRQYNEVTKDYQTSTVVDVINSGIKPVYRLNTSSSYLEATEDHLLLTQRGWIRLGDIALGKDQLIATGKGAKEYKDPKRFKKIDGQWLQKFNRDIKTRVIADQANLCAYCSQNEIEDIHHVVPVHKDPSKAFDRENVVGLCESCHHSVAHIKQGWQTGVFLVPVFETVHTKEYVGEVDTYDLEIAGEFPNFLANGYVVHNSRNSSSSRAIPVDKMIAKVEAEPAMPLQWGINQKGMSSSTELDQAGQEEARQLWLAAWRDAIYHAKSLHSLGLHKQVVNRVLEPFMHIEVVLTATDFNQFFKLRNSPDAQPEIVELARQMQYQYEDIQNGYYVNLQGNLASPQTLGVDTGWHTPFITDEEQLLPLMVRVATSVARCARVSYLLPENGQFSTTERDVELCNRLVSSGHFSPTEHIATPSDHPVYFGNFKGWKQLRKFMAGENTLPGGYPSTPMARGFNPLAANDLVTV